MLSLVVVACALVAQDYKFVPIQRRPPHEVKSVAYRVEDFELDYAVEDWVIDQSVPDPTQPLPLEFYQRRLPQVVSNNVKLIYRGDYKSTMAAIRNLTKLDRKDFHWVIWLSRSNHSQVRVAVRHAVRGHYACQACGGNGWCSQFVRLAAPGKEKTCRTCEWSEGMHLFWSEMNLKCIWCDGSGLFGEVGELRSSLPGPSIEKGGSR